MPAIRIEGLEKTYTAPRWQFWRSTHERALRRIDLEIEAGEVFGVVGPNGAGKSTLINVLSGLVYPDEGTVEVLGMAMPAEREAIAQRMNVATAYSMLSGQLTVEENLGVFGRIYGVANLGERIDEVLSLFEIEDLRGTRVFHLSTGQKTRANLAKSLINEPEVLLLDEATAGLDPHIAAVTRDAIRRLNAERGTTIVVTSHDMADIDELSDRMLFLHEGETLRIGRPADLARDVTVRKLRVEVDRVTRSVEEFAEETGATVDGTSLRVSLDGGTAGVMEALGDLDVAVRDIETTSRDLDELFEQVARGEL